jgi:hypothetical protein
MVNKLFSFCLVHPALLNTAFSCGEGPLLELFLAEVTGCTLVEG